MYTLHVQGRDRWEESREEGRERRIREGSRRQSKAERQRFYLCILLFNSDLPLPPSEDLKCNTAKTQVRLKKCTCGASTYMSLFGASNRCLLIVYLTLQQLAHGPQI